MREQQPAPLTLAEYVQTLPLWRKNLCNRLNLTVRHTGLTFGIWLNNAVCGVSYPAGYWLYRTMRDVGYDAGYWLYVVVSGYPWKKYRKARRSQRQQEHHSCMSQEEYPHGVLREDDEVTILTKDPQSYFPGEQALLDYLWSLPLWRRRLSFRLYVYLRNAGVACGTACGYLALLLVSGYPWNKQRRVHRRQKYSDEI